MRTDGLDLFCVFEFCMTKCDAGHMQARRSRSSVRYLRQRQNLHNVPKVNIEADWMEITKLRKHTRPGPQGCDKVCSPGI